MYIWLIFVDGPKHNHWNFDIKVFPCRFLTILCTHCHYVDCSNWGNKIAETDISHQSGRLKLGLERHTTRECHVTLTLGWELQLSDPALTQVKDLKCLMGKSDGSKAQYFLSSNGNRADRDVQRQEDHAAWGHVHQDQSVFLPFSVIIISICSWFRMYIWQHNCGAAKNKYSKRQIFVHKKKVN